MSRLTLLLDNVKKLKALKILNPISYSQLEKNFLKHSIKDEPSLNLIFLAKQSLLDEKLSHQIKTQHENISSHALSLYYLRAFQTELKEAPSPTHKALNLVKTTDPLLQLYNTIPSKDVLRVIRNNARMIHPFLTPNLQIYREEKQIKEKPFDTKSFVEDTPNAILVMGNNDLIQIDHIVSLCKLVPAEKIPMVLISGFGGHGTVQGKVFGLSEGDTIKRHLLERGIPEEKLILETDAVDTGMNVKKIETIILIEYIIKNKIVSNEDLSFLQSMKNKLQKRNINLDEQVKLEQLIEPIKKQLIANKTAIYPHILISHSPAALLRGTRTYEQQATLPWHKISCVAPEKLFEQYYNTIPNALLSFMLLLREVATFLDYTVNSAYLSSRKINHQHDLKTAIQVCIKYYNLMTQQKIKASRFIKLFMEFYKYHCEGFADITLKTELINRLNLIIKPMALYFRTCFFYSETHWMKQLPNHLTLKNQAEILDVTGTYQRLGLIRASQNNIQSPSHKDTKDCTKPFTIKFT